MGIGLASGDAKWLIAQNGSTNAFTIGLGADNPFIQQLQTLFGISNISQLTVGIILDKFPEMTQEQAQQALDQIKAYVETGNNLLTLGTDGSVMRRVWYQRRRYEFVKCRRWKAKSANSVAFSYVTADGNATLAAGDSLTSANGRGSVALGVMAIARGEADMAGLGSSNDNDTGAVAIGEQVSAEGRGATALGIGG